MPENQPQPQQKTEFMGAGWGSDLMRKWKSLGQNIGVQNVALARLLNKLSEDMGFSPPPSNKIKTRGGPGAVVEAISGPVANPKSITGAIRILKQYAPEFAKKVKTPLFHNTGLTELMKIVKEGGLKGLKSSGAGGFEVVSPTTGKTTGAISLTRSAEAGVAPVSKPTNVQLIYEKEDIRQIGKLRPYSWQPKSSGGGSAKVERLDEAEEVLRQRLSQSETVKGLGPTIPKKRGFPRAYKDTPIIPNDILRGLVIRGGREFPSKEAFGAISQLDVPTVLTPRATQMMMIKDYGGSRFPPSNISRFETKNIVPTYETGSQGSYVGDLSTDFRGTGTSNQEFLMQLLEWLGQQAR